MMNVIAQPSADWAGNIRSWGLIWGLPRAVIIVGFFVDEPLRTVMWVISLGWMGTACLLNARRCGRTHCRFMGPYYCSTSALHFATCGRPSGRGENSRRTALLTSRDAFRRRKEPRSSREGATRAKRSCPKACAWLLKKSFRILRKFARGTRAVPPRNIQSF
jgi:hypothetical protein